MRKHMLRRILLTMLFVLEICLAALLAGVFMHGLLPAWLTAAAAAAGFASAFFMPDLSGRMCRWGGVLCALLTVGMAAEVLLYARSAVYREADNGKEALYADKKVMVVVPHQDDEINLAGGVMEEYIRYGSEVYVVYATNGDCRVPAEQRLGEAINALAVLGVDEEHIIFLGYGDGCTDENGVPIYNTDKQVTSNAGHSYTCTYAGHPPFREGRAYTRQNILEDIRDVILEYRPDVIYGVDCDIHQDHQLTALLFDRAVGEILRDTDYKPLVYKGFAYSTAYYAPDDFYQLNIKSTVNPGEGLRAFAPGIYDWGERVRMPVSAGSLSHSMLSSRIFRAALEHKSQDEAERVGQIVSGDKVFWRRETTSLCYDAQVTASSGDAGALTDFLLGDTSNVLDAANNVTGIWHGGADDPDKEITVTFDTPQSIRRIKLYDDPSPQRNILDAVISFDNGDSVNTGSLSPLGSETVIETDEDNVRSFTVQITEYDGDEPGLTEIEAYSGAFDAGVSFVKLMNADGDFVYDYYIDPSGTERFSLYTYGCSAEAGAYEISCTGGDGCRAYADGESVVVECPRGESCEVTVTDGVNADTAIFRGSGGEVLTYGMETEKLLYRNIRNIIDASRNMKVFLEHFFSIKKTEMMYKLAYLRWGIHRVGEIVFGA